MRPFDLEKAKAGAPICSRKGRFYEYIGCSNRDISYPVVVYQMNGEPRTFTKEGRHNRTDCNDYDLHMGPLFWCENRPVYEGDILFDLEGNKNIIRLNAGLVYFSSSSKPVVPYLHTEVNDFVWEKPKPETKWRGWMNVQIPPGGKYILYPSQEEAENHKTPYDVTVRVTR